MLLHPYTILVIVDILLCKVVKLHNISLSLYIPNLNMIFLYVFLCKLFQLQDMKTKQHDLSLSNRWIK